MPLVKHYIPNDEELKLRLKHQKVVKKRETSEDLTNELFTVTVVEKMNLLSQVLTAASIDKYHIVLGERIVVASASSYDSIYADWLVLQEIKPEDFVGARRAQLILERVEELRQEQKMAKKSILSVVPLESLIPFASSALGRTDSEFERAAAAPATATASASTTVALSAGGEELFTDEIYENQRSGLIGDFSSNWLLLTDSCGPWSDAAGNQRTKESVMLAAGWEWRGDWRIDVRRDGVDKNGWEYALNWNTGWSPEKGATTFVRRRRWVRERVNRNPPLAPRPIDAPSPLVTSPSSASLTRAETPTPPGTSISESLRTSLDFSTLSNIIVGWTRTKSKLREAAAAAAAAELEADADADEADEAAPTDESAEKGPEVPTGPPPPPPVDMTVVMLNALIMVLATALLIALMAGNVLLEEVDMQLEKVHALHIGDYGASR